MGRFFPGRQSGGAAHRRIVVAIARLTQDPDIFQRLDWLTPRRAEPLFDPTGGAETQLAQHPAGCRIVNEMVGHDPLVTQHLGQLQDGTGRLSGIALAPMLARDPVAKNNVILVPAQRHAAQGEPHHARALPAAGVVGQSLEGGPLVGDVLGQLRAHGVRVELDSSDDRMQKKIRKHTMDKVPFQLIAGGEDRDAGAVSFRFRSGEQENGVPVDQAVERILEAIRTKTQV